MSCKIVCLYVYHIFNKTNNHYLYSFSLGIICKYVFFGHILKDGEASGEEGGEGITDECAMLLTSERHSHVSTLQRVLKSHTNKCGTTCKC